MDLTKEKIKKAVLEYVKMFPTEYEHFQNSHREKLDKKDNKFAEFKGADQVVRHLIDIPATLDAIFKIHLEKEEQDWLFGLGTHKGERAGISWFMKTFPQFKITKDF